MAQWEPQIRTNLEDEIYRTRLDELLGNIPGTLSAGLVNVRFREGCVRLPGGRAAEADDTQATIALTCGLFGGEMGERGAGFAEALAATRPFDSAYLSFAQETLLISRLGQGDRALIATVSPNLNQASAVNLRRAASNRIDNGARGEIGPVLEATNEVLMGALLDLSTGTVVSRYERFQGVSVLQLDGDLIAAAQAILSAGGPVRGLRLRHRDGRAIEIRRAELTAAQRSLHFARLRFDPEHLLVLSADRRAIPGLLSIMMRNTETEIVRVWVDGLLNYGIKSTMNPFPRTQAEFLDIVRELRQLDQNDLLGRLDVGGFANYTMGGGEDMQRCQECIYYLPNGRWCDLPELPVPVEAHWWCRLWKM